MSETPEQRAADLAAQFEGFSASPYLDIGGTPTQGYGSIWRGGNSKVRVTMADPSIDEPTARTWLSLELQSCAAVLAQDVTVKISDAQKAALEDFIYNLGAGNFASSTLLRKLNGDDLAGAADQFDLWDHVGAHVVAGLLRRRQAETDLFKSRDLPA